MLSMTELTATAVPDAGPDLPTAAEVERARNARAQDDARISFGPSWHGYW
jgi:hypothetical protein